MSDKDELRRLTQEVSDLAGRVRDLAQQVSDLIERAKALPSFQTRARSRMGLADAARFASGVLGAAAAAGVVSALLQRSGLANDVRSQAGRIAGVEAELKQTPRLHVGRVVDVNPAQLLVESGGELLFAPFGDAQVGIDGKAARLGDLKPGDAVSVYTDVDGRVIAVEARSQ